MILRSLLLFFCLSLSIAARAGFDFNSNCTKAYREIMHLRLASGKALLEIEKKRNPDNSVVVLLENYMDYFTIITSESKSDFDRLKGNKPGRLSRLEAEDKNSPWYLYCQAEVNLQWALIHGLFQEYFSSSMEINRANKLLKENIKKYPAFLPNKKGFGMVNAVLGSLPEGLKKTIGILGIRGNTADGLAMLDGLVKALPGSPYAAFYDEAVFCQAYVQTDIIGDHAAYPAIVANAREMSPESLLRTYILAYSALRTGHGNDALEFLKKRQQGKEYVFFPKLDYLEGKARIYTLDLGGAGGSFLDFLENYKGINGTKDAYLNLAWVSLLRGNPSGYRENTERVKSRGYALFDKDKQAVSESNDPQPDTDLLRSRLLFDGGYYGRALDVLEGKKAEQMKLLRDKIEYAYRLGRIYDEMGKDDTAIKFYQAAITLGKKQRYYFASNAALRIGSIYEKKKDSARAKTWYKQVIDMKDHDYEKSIEGKAKEGLKRVGG